MIRIRFHWYQVFVSAILILVSAPSLWSAESSLAFPGAANRMIYQSQVLGDRLPNFSNVGYYYGERAIPTVSTAITVQPGPGDDTALIQSAINTVAAMPIGPDGFRGAVELGAGEFQIGSSINIGASGVVLRGAGDSTSGTVLRGTGTTLRTLVTIGAGGSKNRITSSERPILDKYVPVGATSFRLNDASSFQVGDQVVVFRPSTSNWISDIGMDMIPPRPDGGTIVQWTAGSRDLHSDRVITRIEGDRVFINAPITNALDQQYGGGTVYKYTFNSRLQDVGIEGIRGVSDFDGSSDDEDHAYSFIDVDDVEHAWVRDITAQHFIRSAVSIERDAKNVTVQDAHSIDPISIVTGSRRYSFEVDGQLNIVRDSTADSGRHDFILNSPSPGPNVFLDSVATNVLDESGPHQRWSTGALFDNIEVNGDQLNLYNRGYFGTGHGWAGANMVVWNSTADSYIVQNPPTAQNWLIGSVGTVVEDDRFGPQELGIIDQHGAAVDTRSLYLQQLADRMERTNGELREYVIGDYDSYVNDGLGSVDDPPVSQNLINAFSSIIFGSGDPTEGFDDLAGPALRPFTWDYQLDSDEQVYHAVLSLAVRSTGGDTTNDTVWFEDLTNALNFSTDLGFTQQLSATESTVFALEFAGADLTYFQDGEFNVLINNDVAIDWARLEIYVADSASGDFNMDGALDCADVDALVVELAANSGDLAFDLNGDGSLDNADLDEWLAVAGAANLSSGNSYLYGDANLNGVVDGVDFTIWNQSKFTATAAWCSGDFNANGVVDGVDFTIWNANKFTSSADSVVPEPGAVSILVLAMLFGTCSVRRRG